VITAQLKAPGERIRERRYPLPNADSSCEPPPWRPLPLPREATADNRLAKESLLREARSIALLGVS